MEEVLAVAFSPDGHMVLTGSRYKRARLWEAPTAKPTPAEAQPGSWHHCHVKIVQCLCEDGLRKAQSESGNSTNGFRPNQFS
jgi:hypothetical protein